MEKLKRVLNDRKFYALLAVLTFIYVFILSGVQRESIYSLKDGEVRGTLEKIEFKESSIKITLKSEEDLICNYYIDEEFSIDEFREDYRLGSEVIVKGTLKEPLNNTVPNTFNYKRYLYNKGIFYTCVIEDIEVIEYKPNVFYRFKNFVIDRIMSFRVRDYLNTMIIGDKSLLEEEVMNSYKENGVTHLFAISGMHIGLFSGVIIAVLKRFRVKENKAYLAAVAFIWLYAFLAGFSASVLRAGLLFTLLTIDKILDLKIKSIYILVATGSILIFSNYRIIYDLGFLYSFVTTFGLVYSSDVLKRHPIMGTSLTAFLYSLPITVYNFYSVNFASIFINILFVPFVSIVVYPLCLLTFIFRFLEPATLFAIEILEGMSRVLSFVQLSFTIPKPGVIAIAVYYVILLCFFRKKFYAVSVILIGLVLLSKVKPRLDPNIYVEFLDVGQGDSAIIRDREEVVMIDTGGIIGYGEDSSSYFVSDNTITYLRSLGIERIDTMILSHGDTDHLGDALHVIENMEVGEVILNRGETNEKEQMIIQSGVAISEVYSGHFDLEILMTKDFKDENANSTVVFLNTGKLKFIFMGDATKETEGDILSKYRLKADVIKLGHHGSKTSSGEEFLQAIDPSRAIISSGRNNRYGHPSKETLETLLKLKIDHYNTQIDGSIIYKIGQKGCTESTYPP